MVIGILGLLAALAGVLTAFFQWKTSQPENPNDVLEREFTDSIQNVLRLRQLAKYAEADAMLERLSVVYGVSKPKPTGGGNPDANGQRLGDSPPRGNDY